MFDHEGPKVGKPAGGWPISVARMEREAQSGSGHVIFQSPSRIALRPIRATIQLGNS
jgi:hypothetical protein